MDFPFRPGHAVEVHRSANPGFKIPRGAGEVQAIEQQYPGAPYMLRVLMPVEKRTVVVPPAGVSFSAQDPSSPPQSPVRPPKRLKGHSQGPGGDEVQLGKVVPKHWHPILDLEASHADQEAAAVAGSVHSLPWHGTRTTSRHGSTRR